LLTWVKRKGWRDTPLEHSWSTQLPLVRLELIASYDS